MKKFSFPLDTVLKYKDQILESLRNEHGKIISRINEQESVILHLRQQYNEYNAVFNEKKLQGITIIEAISYEGYLREIENMIRQEKEKLNELKQLAEQKRLEVVEAKKETASIEKLKERKIEQHNKEAAKSEELFIEEFVAYARSAGSAS